MNDGLNDHEDFIRVSRFASCDRFEVTEDLVFAYPSSEFVGDAESIANELQREMDYLKNVTGLKPREELGSKVVVGYRRREEGGTGRQGSWSGADGNRVFLSWGYLEDFDKGEPMDICSHELVHPFFFVSPLHEINEFWGEGFCDFLRGPLKNFMGLDGNEWWGKKIKEARDNKQDKGGNAAGQSVIRACEWCRVVNERDQFIDNQAAIREFVNRLFDRYGHLPMSEEFRPTKWITWKERRHCKGPFRDLSG